jgi:tellurite resistance protein
MRHTDPSFVKDLDDSKLEALVEMMYLAATADGEFSDEERAEFIKHAEELTVRVASADRLEAIIDRAKQAVESDGREARLDAVKNRLPDPGARRLALSLAIRVTAIDGVIRTSERELIMETAEVLGIDGETAADLVRDISAGR